ncbi:unnamed protein product [Microthlaspi erraticum]|uniref:Uncharacterized protein n=1 Tax=Microthlaspi erraticum TaxID=1685480 RepID=A0A6D2KD26_9BRAS|nr:unnamed protein product [Microthlaspi erraticum]
MLTRARKRQMTTATERTPNPSLPDDVMVSIFARVPISYYPCLYLVSKRFQSLLVSPELHKTRSLLGRRKENFLYVCLTFPTDPNPRWFTLCRKPDQALTKSKRKKKSSGNVLAPFTTFSSPKIERRSCLEAIGSNIYKIGRSTKDEPQPSSSVLFLDCRSHTWREAPSFLVERSSPLIASVVGGKIYVLGGTKDHDVDPWDQIEMFDSETQTWDHVPKHNLKLDVWGFNRRIACVDGKLHLKIEKQYVAYDPMEIRWDVVERDMFRHRSPSIHERLAYCTVNNVFYRYSYCHTGDTLKWYDTESEEWKKVKGVLRLPKFHESPLIRLADYGGKMAVLWEKLDSCSSGLKTLWCAVIKLERRKDDEIRAKVEWVDGVLQVPYSYEFVKALGVTV